MIRSHIYKKSKQEIRRKKVETSIPKSGGDQCFYYIECWRTRRKIVGSCLIWAFLHFFFLSEVKESELRDPSPGNLKEDGSLPPLTLVRKQFGGRYAITSDEFSSEMVGLKKEKKWLAFSLFYYWYFSGFWGWMKMYFLVPNCAQIKFYVTCIGWS